MTAIYFPPDDIIELGPDEVERLKRTARESPTGRARYCLHASPLSTVHDMLIAFWHRGYVRPHRHPQRAETLHAVEGDFDVVIFDDGGQAIRRIPLGPPGSGRTLMYRLPAAVWHTVVPLTEMVILHEVTEGPFVPEGVEFPAWAPPAEATGAVAAFLARMSAQIP